MVRQAVKLNVPGIVAILNSPAMSGELSRRAARIARAAGDGHRSDVSNGRDRKRARVWTATYAARKAQAQDRTLTRALDAGR